jgi:hypothetical protein
MDMRDIIPEARSTKTRLLILKSLRAVFGVTLPVLKAGIERSAIRFPGEPSGASHTNIGADAAVMLAETGANSSCAAAGQENPRIATLIKIAFLMVCSLSGLAGLLCPLS